MDFSSKINNLKECVAATLKPIIGKRVIIPDAPYYCNIGDILIWQGMIDYLKHAGCELLHVSDRHTFSFPVIDRDVTILLTGGGNFGDLWRIHHTDRLKIIARYPDNRIVMCPQSVWYTDKNLIRTDSDAFAMHTDLHLCARDRWSYEFMKKHFGRNHTYLVPDMAFCIADHRLAPFRGNKKTNRYIFVRRNDKELRESTPASLHDPSSIGDWPTLEHTPRHFFLFRKAFATSGKLRNNYLCSSVFNGGVDYLASILIRRAIFKTGCRFLAPYSGVVTTRLHAMILAVLLHKPVKYIDNTTGKLSAYAESWLSDLPDVACYEPEH